MTQASVGDRLHRALSRLNSPRAIIARVASSERYGVFNTADRRRRPTASLRAEEVKACLAEGLLDASDVNGVYQLSDAGRAWLKRSSMEHDGFRAQHMDIVLREFMNADGGAHRVRGVDPEDAIARLRRTTDGAGQAWFSRAEMAAARRIRADWNDGQLGLYRGSDWSAPPLGANARGPGGAQDYAPAVAIDARARFSTAMAKLSPSAQRVVKAICFEEKGFEAVEAAERWPARSAKLALKCALETLAQHYGVA
jgi:hypothetical protein